jgi:hypothetical protein
MNIYNLSFSKMYYLSTVTKSVNVCHINGTSCVTLKDANGNPYNRTMFEESKSLALWPSKGYLFYGEMSLSPYVGRMAMDGQL